MQQFLLVLHYAIASCGIIPFAVSLGLFLGRSAVLGWLAEPPYRFAIKSVKDPTCLLAISLAFRNEKCEGNALPCCDQSALPFRSQKCKGPPCLCAVKGVDYIMHVLDSAQSGRGGCITRLELHPFFGGGGQAT